MSRILLDTFDWWARERADTIALDDGNQKISYAELKHWSSGVSEWLIEQGFALGDRATLLAANSTEWCVLAQAVLRAGGILAPINPRFTASEVEYMNGRYESTYIFYDAERQDIAQTATQSQSFCTPQTLSNIHRHRDRSKTPLTEQRRAQIGDDAEVVIIPTSGSTAHPKGVVYSNRTMLDYCTQFALAEPEAACKPGIIIFAPLCTSAGYVVFIQHLVYGGTVYISQAFDPVETLRHINAQQISSIMGVPYFLEQIAALDEFDSADFSSIKMVTVGGSRCSESLLQSWLAKGVLVKQLYGQTECGGQGTINTTSAALTHPEKCGHGNIFTRIAIKNEAGEFCPAGVPGEIVINGLSIMVRYWNDPEATANTLKDGWLHTGDLGVLDDDGLLTFLDRLKDIIISGGLNISVAEVERVVCEFPGVVEAAVIAAKDEKFGETPVAVIYTNATIDSDQLFQHCKRELTSYKVPKYFAFETEPLPRLATQKISKPILRERYKEAHTTLTALK